MFNYYVGDLSSIGLGFFLFLFAWLGIALKVLNEGNIPMEGSLPAINIKGKGIKNLSTFSQVLPILVYISLIALLLMLLKIALPWEIIALLISLFVLAGVHADYGWNILNPGEDFGIEAFKRRSYPDNFIGIIPVRYIKLVLIALVLWYIVTGEIVVWGTMFIVSTLLAIATTVILPVVFKKQLEELRIFFKVFSLKSVWIYGTATDDRMANELHCIVSEGDFLDQGGEELYRFKKTKISEERRFQKGFNPQGLNPKDVEEYLLET